MARVLLHCSLYQGMPPVFFVQMMIIRIIMMTMREMMVRMRAIMKTIFTGAAHGESEDGGGVAVTVAVVLEFA